MKYFPQTPEDIRAMLERIGVQNLDDLFAEIPEELKLKGELQIPHAQTEMEVRRTIGAMAAENRPLCCFAGGGVYDRYVPSMVGYLCQRSEFSTSYTPYQAEISQGTLQYIFEYQTMMARLTGMDVSNASMYDGATATAEAMMMCVASAKGKRHRVVVSQTLFPEVLDVVRTYADYHGVTLCEVGPDAHGLTCREAINAALAAADVAGVIVPLTNRYGLIEDLTGLADACHAAGALLAINSVASHLALLKSPGEWGADIACGDAQSLGIDMGCGGPYIGYLCTTNALVRKMPGRLVGQTVDAAGNRCFVLTLQAREQHIRREKATSNICTAQGIMCLHVAIYLALMGQAGLAETEQTAADGAHCLCQRLAALPCFEQAFPESAFLNEFTLCYTGCRPLADVMADMADRGFLAGIAGADGTMLTLAVTEQRTPDEVDALVKAFAEVCQAGCGTNQ